MIALAARTLIASAVYGYGVGSAHSELYALRNLLKFPLLLTVTAVVCAVSHWVVSRALASTLSFARVQRAVIRMFHDTSLLLASLSPVVWFVGRSLRVTDDGRLGSYDTFLAVNVVAIAAAGGIALVRVHANLLREHDVPRGRARALLALWLGVSLAVGGQAAFYMRPFFGIPATRGGDPPFFLGATPDVRGATSFYEAVWQTIARPELR